MTPSHRLRSLVRRVTPIGRPRHQWTLIFSHIPKTAGTSIRVAISQAYRPNECLYLYDAPNLDRAMRAQDFPGLPEAERRRLRFVMGHVHYGLHAHIPGESRYVTVLREPVDRVVSQYYHYRQVADPSKSGRPAAERRMIEEQGMSLEDWIFRLQRVQADNQLIRYVSGRPDVPFGGCTPDMLTEALDHVDRHFELVMFSEHLAEGTHALASRLGVHIPSDVRLNVNAQRPGMTDIEPALADRVRELNRFDVEFYEAMLARFGPATGSRP